MQPKKNESPRCGLTEAQTQSGKLLVKSNMETLSSLWKLHEYYMHR